MKKVTEMSVGLRIMMVIIQCILLVGFLGTILLYSAGKLIWVRAWILLGTYATCFITTTTIFVLKVPELIDERRKRHDNEKKWDRPLVLAYQVMYFPIFILSGLDERFGWSDFPFWISLIAIFFFIFFFLIITRATLVNKHLETYLRIQHDRNHKVCTTGPYKYVRHPTYIGLVLFFLAVPISLNSLWGLIHSIVAVIILIIRTIMEDNFLKKELSGYLEYSDKTRYRWIPWIW